MWASTMRDRWRSAAGRQLRSRRPAMQARRASLDNLAGPTSIWAQSLRRFGEFYEHTTRFALDIVPWSGGPGSVPAPALQFASGKATRSGVNVPMNSAPGPTRRGVAGSTRST